MIFYYADADKFETVAIISEFKIELNGDQTFNTNLTNKESDIYIETTNRFKEDVSTKIVHVHKYQLLHTHKALTMHTTLVLPLSVSY